MSIFRRERFVRLDGSGSELVRVGDFEQLSTFSSTIEQIRILRDLGRGCVIADIRERKRKRSIK